MFTTLLQIAKNTFRESLREPIYLLMMISALVLIGFFPVLTLYVFWAQEKMVIDSSMAVMMVFGWGLAIMLSSYTISREIDNGTALLLLSKPVQRPVFIIAKILGIMAANFVFCVITGIASLIALRVSTDQFWIDNFMLYGFFVAIALALGVAGIYNYVTRGPFCSAAVVALLCILPILAIIGQFKTDQGTHVGLAFRVIPALLLVTFSVLSMGTLATALSTRFGLVPNLLLCAALFMLGLMSDYLIGRNARERWYSVPPKGAEQLWVADYDFSPSELAPIEAWNSPQRIEDFADFTVWSDSTKALDKLPALGDAPASSWKDGQGWKANPADTNGQIFRMAAYDAKNEEWRYYELGANGAKQRDGSKNFTAVVFRRSDNPPRLPSGGTYNEPLPYAGNYVASALYATIPNWQLFWMADALSSRGNEANVNTEEPTVPAIYVGYAAAYAVCLNIFLALLAILLFWNREVGKQSFGG